MVGRDGSGEESTCTVREIDVRGYGWSRPFDPVNQWL